MIVLLGDLLYHGPRNDLPMEYDCKKVSSLLNLYKEKTHIRDIYNAYRRSLREEARLDRFKESLHASIEKLPKLDFVENKTVNIKATDSEAFCPEAELQFLFRFPKYFRGRF